MFLVCERKQKEIADLLACNSIDIVAVQESWEQEDSKMDISGLENVRLDRQIDRDEIAQCVKKKKNNKTGGCDGIVGELLKYGGSGMVSSCFLLFGVRS